MYTTLTLLGKHVIQTNLSMCDERLLSEIHLCRLRLKEGRRGRKKRYILVGSSAREKEKCIDLIDWYNLILKNLGWGEGVFVTCFSQAVLCHNPYCHHIIETQEIPLFTKFCLAFFVKNYRRILLFSQFQFSTDDLFSKICSLCKPFLFSKTLVCGIAVMVDWISVLFQ